jgi:exopolysaccharide biosynthesis WecB/TagA/CpsF family protein
MADRYLIVQLADIGDLVLSTPALAALREAHPDAEITLLTTAHSAPVVEGTGLVDKIVTFDKHTFDNPKALLQRRNLRKALSLAGQLHRGKYDATVFFHHFTTRFGAFKFVALAWSAASKRRIGLDNGNGWFLTERLPDGGFGAKHQAQYWLDLVGLLGANTSARPAVVKMESKDVRSGDLLGHPYRHDMVPLVVIHAGSGGYSLARRWDTEKFAVVADRLHEEYGAQIVLVGSAGDDTNAVKAAMKTQPIDLSGQTNPAQLAAVLRSADLFIGADSGVMHIAAAVGTPVAAIFGPSNPDAWGPWPPGGKSIVVRSAPECSPCSYVGDSVGLRHGCAARTCMRMVTADQVLAAARVLLTENSVRTQGAVSLPNKTAFPKRIHILGLPVDAITYVKWLDFIEKWIDFPLPEGEGLGVRARHVCTINPEFMMIAQNDVNFFNILSRADLCVPDGVGLLWAARHLGKPLPERVTGSDGVPRIAERAAQSGWRLFFLGAAPGIADKAAEVLRASYPGLQVVGTYSGSPAPEEEDAIVKRVNAASADILFVAYGAPEQDKWIARNLPRLRVTMAMGVGGAFDFIAGIVPRAPLWMQRLGLEWLFRLYLQPWRIGRMMRLPRFVLAILLNGKNMHDG